MTRSKFTLVLLALLTLVLAMPAFAGGVQVKRETARPIDSVQGVDLYNAYCAVCHGKDGKGSGPAAVALKAPMPDLTVLAKKNGGKFSSADVTAAMTDPVGTLAARAERLARTWSPPPERRPA